MMRSWESGVKGETSKESARESFDDYDVMETALRGLELVAANKTKAAVIAEFRRKAGLEERDENTGAEEKNEADEEGYGGGGEAVEENYDEDWEADEDYDGYEDDWEEDEDWEYDLGAERQEEKEREHKFELLTIPAEILQEYNLPDDLPKGVAVMGGTARSMARRVITGEKEPVRDLDLVYIPEFDDKEEPDREELDATAAKYMPDDFQYGHGIERVDLEKYFEERDFTINQCLVIDDKLLVTRAAYDDFQENIIRPAYFEQRYENSYVGDRMFLKALLLKAVLKDCTESYPTIEDMVVPDLSGDDYVSDFQLALFLNKAMGRGVRVAMHFTEALVDFDVAGEKYMDRPLALAKAVLEDGNIYSFEFRPTDGKIEETEDELAKIEKVYASDKKIRQELADYRNGEKFGREERAEPIDGQYAAEDYEYLNRILREREE